LAEGFIKLHRCLIDKPIFQNEKLLKVWLWCLFKATHKPITALVGRQKVDLQPGQFIYGRQKAAEALGIPPSTVRDYMGLLQKGQSIDIKPDSKFSVVTIVNWGLYQAKGKNPDSKPDSRWTADGQQMDTYKNDKNDKNDKKKDIYISAQHLSITKAEYEKLVEKHGKELVNSKIEYAQNYAKLKNYVSLYKTLDNWLKKDGQQPKGKKSSPLDYLDDIDLGD